MVSFVAQFPNVRRTLLLGCLLALGSSVFGQLPVTGTSSKTSLRHSAAASRTEAARTKRGASLQFGSTWPKFHANGFNTGLSTSGGSNGLMRWDFTTGGSVFSSPAVAADGTIYVGSTDYGFYAVNPNGTVKWSITGGSYIESSPAIGKDGTIYVGSDDGYLNALTPQGAKLWGFPTGGPVYSFPTVGADGTVYFGSQDGNIYAVSSAGNKIWKYATGAAIFDSSPAIDSNGIIYVGSTDNNLYALNPNGTLKWTFPTNNIIESSAAIGPDGTIYVGSNDGNLYAINPDGTQKWAFATGSFVESSPAIGKDGTIYFGSDDYNFYAVNPDGTQKWAYTTGGNIFSSAAIGSDGTIYVGSFDNYLYAFTPSGTLLGSFATNDWIESSPAIGADGTVYVGSDDGGLYAIGTQVNTVPVKTLTINPTSVAGGSNSTGTVTLTSAAPVGGDIVTLLSSDPSVIPPAFVTVPGGATTASFTIQTVPVPANVSAVVTASSGSINATAALRVTATGPVSLTINPNSTVGGSQATGTVTLGTAAPAGGKVVMLSSGNSIASTPATVTVAAGSTTATFNIATVPTAQPVTLSISATADISTTTATLTVNPPVGASLVLSPTSVVGGTDVTGTFTLNGAAPTGGIDVALSSSSSSAVAPTSVHIAEGATSSVFTISTSAVSTQSNVTITGSVGGSTKTATLTIVPPTLVSITLAPSTVVGGVISVGTLNLSGPAPSGGITVSLSSNNSVARTPSTLTVPAGSQTADFNIATSIVTGPTNVTISGVQGTSTKTANLTVTIIGVASVAIAPSTVIGGTEATGTVTLNGPATGSGMTVTIVNNSPTAASMPATLTITAGKTSGDFKVVTKPVPAQKVVTVKVTYKTTSISGSITVNPPKLISMSLNPTSVSGGALVTGTITIGSLAPAGGLPIKLASDKSSVVVPPTMSIPAGKTVGTFVIKTLSVSVDTTAKITSTLGTDQVSATLSVHGPTISGITLNPSTVVGAASSTGTVTLSGPAGSSGLVVNLSSSVNAAIVPASVTVSSGRSTANFTVKTVPVSTITKANISGKVGALSQSATLTINPPVLISISLSPATVKGGKSSTGTVTIGSTAPTGGLTVSIQSSSDSASVDGTATIAAGKTTGTFTVRTTVVTAQTTAKISAILGAITKSANLTVTK